MAFFPIYPGRPPTKSISPKSKREPRTSKPRLLSRRAMPKPIITRGPFSLVWVNPVDPRKRRRRRGDGDDAA